tara:strand:+ start:181 stop:981 length:801 start_codon:yes stop_codon:yes gene_type:complete
MRFLVFIIFFCGFCIFEVNAKDYSGIGKYRFGPNVAESIACDLAFERAKKNALSNAYGEKIFSEDLMRCSETEGDAKCELNKSIISTINGTIKKIKKKNWLPLERQAGYSICTCQIIAAIVKPEKSKDANFDFHMVINKKTFRDDEKFIIQIEPSVKMFINIFQWEPYRSEGSKLTKIFPNKFESNNEIENKKTIPEKKYNYSFIVDYPYETQDKKYVDEYLVVLATKKNINFFNEYEFKNLQERIYEIPNNEFRVKKISYEILKN